MIPGVMGGMEVKKRDKKKEEIKKKRKKETDIKAPPKALFLQRAS